MDIASRGVKSSPGIEVLRQGEEEWPEDLSSNAATEALEINGTTDIAVSCNTYNTGMEVIQRREWIVDAMNA